MSSKLRAECANMSSQVETRVRRPKNAFVVWAMNERKRLAQQNSGLPKGELSKILGKAWRALTRTEKMPFFVEAERLKEQHTQDHTKKPKKRKLDQKKKRSGNGFIGIKEQSEQTSTDGRMCLDSFSMGYNQDQPYCHSQLPQSTSHCKDHHYDYSLPTPEASPVNLAEADSLYFTSFAQEVVPNLYNTTNSHQQSPCISLTVNQLSQAEEMGQGSPMNNMIGSQQPPQMYYEQSFVSCRHEMVLPGYLSPPPESIPRVAPSMQHVDTLGRVYKAEFNQYLGYATTAEGGMYHHNQYRTVSHTENALMSSVLPDASTATFCATYSNEQSSCSFNHLSQAEQVGQGSPMNNMIGCQQPPPMYYEQSFVSSRHEMVLPGYLSPPPEPIPREESSMQHVNTLGRVYKAEFNQYLGCVTMAEGGMYHQGQDQTVSHKENALMSSVLSDASTAMYYCNNYSNA
ncbi:transcription factor Sox-17-alpha [Pelobates cultripes]|uniref:Transcription factor Sox-17-alpha n=1 Tax=Pelobates cultripes TaxID=61616 RepID=A0AAD1W6F0_PELCU|nr:transcription factor Sox-17-alpha [Pelobates cultripes]